MAANINTNVANNIANSNVPLQKGNWLGRQVCAISTGTLLFAAALIITGIVLFALRSSHHAAAFYSSGLAALCTGGALFLLGIFTHCCGTREKGKIATEDSSTPTRHVPPSQGESLEAIRAQLAALAADRQPAASEPEELAPQGPTILEPEVSIKDFFENQRRLYGVPKELLDWLELLRKSRRGEITGVQFGAGMILYGPSGNGKTAIANCIAEILGGQLLVQNVAELKDTGWGITDNRLRAIQRTMEDAEIRGKFPVVLLDEIGSLFPARQPNQKRWYDGVIETFQSIVAARFTQKPSSLYIGTTNDIKNVDAAITTPGRLGKTFEIKPPDEQSRAHIFGYRLSEALLTPVDFQGNDLMPLAEKLAHKTEGYSCAQIVEYVSTLKEKSLLESRSLTEEEFFASLLSPPPPAADPKEAIKCLDPSKSVAAFLEENGLFGMPEELIMEVELWRRYLRKEDLDGLTFGSGFLLYGSPGNGKTSVAKLIAEEILGIDYKELACGSLNSRWHGDTEKAINDLFNIPAGQHRVICIDEIDGLVYKSSDELEWHTRIVNHFISVVDGAFTQEPRYLLIGTTNHRERLDERVLREGRLGVQIEIKNPPLQARAQIFIYHLNKVKSLTWKDEIQAFAQELAKKTERYSCTDIIGSIQKAKKRAFMQNRPLTQQDVLQGLSP